MICAMLFLQLGLITAKPVLYVCNVAEADAATGNAYSQCGGGKGQGRKCGGDYGFGGD